MLEKHTENMLDNVQTIIGLAESWPCLPACCSECVRQLLSTARISLSVAL